MAGANSICVHAALSLTLLDQGPHRLEQVDSDAMGVAVRAVGGFDDPVIETVAVMGMPMSSASRNFTPASSARSSRTSTPAAVSSR